MQACHLDIVIQQQRKQRKYNSIRSTPHPPFFGWKWFGFHFSGLKRNCDGQKEWCQSLCPSSPGDSFLHSRERALFSSEAQGPSYIALYSKDNVRHIGLERGCHCSSAWSGGNAALLLLCSENDPAAQLKCLLLTWMDPCRRCKWFPASSS